MVIKDTFRNKILWYKFVRNETIADYMEGIAWLREHGFRIHDIVCGGIRGLCMALNSYPVQMCHFHQMMIVRRYLTNRPELPAAQELLALTTRITYLDKALLSQNLIYGRSAGMNFSKSTHATEMDAAPIRIREQGVLI